MDKSVTFELFIISIYSVPNIVKVGNLQMGTATRANSTYLVESTYSKSMTQPVIFKDRNLVDILADNGLKTTANSSQTLLEI